MSHSHIRTSLQHAPVSREAEQPDQDQAWEACRAAWHEHGFALLNPDAVEARMGWAAGQEARGLAERCFGKRGASFPA